MTISVSHGSRTYQLGRGVDLSIPLNFRGPQPNAYGVPPANAAPYSGDGFLLDVARGGSCNCEVLTITPHCHGTHTECAGHLTREKFAIASIELPPFIPATLISVEPRGRAIGAEEIEKWKYDVAFCDALVVRTLPNEESKKTRRWENDTTPYFTPAAMAAIRGLGVQHLLVDLPSLDPLYDDGKLAAHRIYWDLPPGSTAIPEAPAGLRTVTEMIFVPDGMIEGSYWLSLQVPRIGSDAAPSRPFLYAIDDQT